MPDFAVAPVIAIISAFASFMLVLGFFSIWSNMTNK